MVIVGAGPVGLLAALGASRRGCGRILILEQAREFRKAGLGIDMYPNCLKAFKLVAPDVYITLQETNALQGQSYIANFTPAGELRWKVTRDRRVLTIGWYKLQTALRQALPENVEVRIDAHVIALKEVNGNAGAVVEYVCGRPRYNRYSQWNVEGATENDDGFVSTGSEKKVRAKVVIGADGINSRCREELYRIIGGESWAALAPPIYSGYTGVLYFPSATSLAAKKLADKLKEENVSVGKFVSGGKLNRVTVMTGQDLFCVYSVARLPLRLRDKLDEVVAALTTLVNEEISYEPLTQLFSSIEKKELELKKLFCLPQFVVPPEYPPQFQLLNNCEKDEAPDGFRRPFGHGRVFLTGDSLHGCPPTLAQGTAMGFEDVCELIDILAGAFNWGAQKGSNTDSEVLKHVERSYRESRIERIRLVQDHSVYPKVLTEDEFAEVLQFLYNWIPKAAGW